MQKEKSLCPAAGRFGMRSALLCASIAERLFKISRLSHSAECSKRIFTGESKDACRNIPEFSLRCNHSARSTVCSTEKVSKFCPAAKRRNKDRLPFLGGKVMRFADFDTTFAKDSPQRY